MKAAKAMSFAIVATFLPIGPSQAAQKMLFWNETAHEMTGVYLAQAGTSSFGPNQALNDPDKSVSADERLAISGVAPGAYDVKLVDAKGRTCIVRNVDVKGTGKVAFFGGREAAHRLQVTPSLKLAAALLALLSLSAPLAAQTPKVAVSFLYLGLATAHAVPSTSLQPPLPFEEGVQGARLGVSENVATGRFLGIGFDMQEARPATEGAVLDAARAALADGRRVLVTDLPAPLLLKLADLPEAVHALILDVATADDALRGPDCRPNVLHVAPSRAMLADALMQYLVVKQWRQIMLLSGRTPPDRLYAEALRQSARKFRVKITADREWTFDPAAQQADTGHYQVNAEVALITQGESYDMLVAADEAGAFASQLAYRTNDPRPIAGSAGLVAQVWTPLYDEYGGAQLQLRFRNRAHRPMTALDFDAWVAVRAVGEAAVRGGASDAVAMATYLRGPDFQVAGYKGAALSFRPWDGQLRQPILLADDRALVAISPQPGFLHQFSTLDTLGVDQPESACHPP